MSRTTKVNKPFCKVCKDAGKPESEYTSHWVKDLNGKTICPTLLNTECRYCFKLGHTTKFCDVLAKHNKEKERAERKLKASEKPTPVVQKKPQNTGANGTNMFAVLCESDSEEEVSVPIEYPSLSNIEVKAKPEVKTGWASALMQSLQVKAVEPVKPTEFVLLSDYIKTQGKVAEKPKPAPWAPPKQAAKKSWADESDSEDEESLPEINYGQEDIEDDTW